VNPLTQSSIESPFRTFFLATLILLASAAGLYRLRLRTDGQAMVPVNDEAVRYDALQRERFNIRDSIAIVITRQEGIFERNCLALVRELTDSLLQLEEVNATHLLSLATEPGLLSYEDGIRFRTLLDPLPETAAELDALRHELAIIDLYNGILINPDFKRTAILVGVPAKVDRVALYRRVRSIVAAAQGDTDIEIVGAVVAETLLGNHILADLGVPAFLLDLPEDGPTSFPYVGLVPPALLLMVLIFFGFFRRFPAALLPLLEVGACLLFVFGVMAWLDVPIYLTTAVLPVILTAVGVADEVHIFACFTRLKFDHPELETHDLVRKTMALMAPPVFKTSVTTTIGFLSFLLSPLAPVRFFGLFTALGVLACLLFSLTVIPALLVCLGPRHLIAAKPVKLPAFSPLARLQRPTRPILALVLVLFALFVVSGIRKLKVQDSWIDGFDPKSEFGKAMRSFDQNFLGMHQLVLVVSGENQHIEGEFPAENLEHPNLRLPYDKTEIVPDLTGWWLTLSRPEKLQAGRRPWDGWVTSAQREEDHLLLTYPRRRGSPVRRMKLLAGDRVLYRASWEPMRDLAVLQALADAEKFLASLNGVGGVLGPTRLLETADRMSRERVGMGELPNRADKVRIAWNNLETVRGHDRLSMSVDLDFDACQITLFLENSNYADTRAMIDEIRQYEQQYLKPLGLRVGFAGDVAVSQALIRGVVHSQVSSLIVSLIGIFLTACFIGRSLRWGWCCSLPPVFAIVTCFSVMGHFSIPLGVATSMFAGMTLGLGVDFAVHYLTCYDAAGTSDHRASVRIALDEAGPAIVFDALAVGLGFSVLLFSRVPGNARLGLLLVLSTFACLAATLVLLPALQSLFNRRKHVD